jgi:hypothetical protein
VPGIYPNADNQFEHIQGTFRSAAEWIALYPPPAEPVKPAPRPAQKVDAKARDWNAEHHASHILGDYRCLGSGRHQAFYTLGIRLAMSAFNHGHQISETELYGILVDEYHGNKPSSPYTDKEIRRVARDGVDKAQSYVGDDPAYKRLSWLDKQWADLDRAMKAEQAGCFDGNEDLGPDECIEEPVAVHATTGSVDDTTDAEPVVDIFETFDPVPELTRDMLPPIFAEFAFDEAERLGVEPSAIVLPCIIACAAAIHDSIQIQPKERDTRWKESARLWGGVVGEPGVGKTPAINKAVEPSREIEAQWRIEDDRKYAEYKQQMEVYQQEKKAARAEGIELEEPEEPHYRRLLVNETSMEGLAERVLAYNERGVMILSQELMAFIGSFDAYKSGGVKKDRQIALELFDGGSRNRDLVKGTIYCPNWSACILGGIQTDKLRKIAASMTDDGLLQRFLLVEAHSVGIGADRRPNLDAVGDYQWLVQSLANLDPCYFGDPVVLSPEAQEYRREFEELVFILKEDNTLSSAFRGHANKLNGIFARLLLTMHLIETPHNRSDLLPTVTGETARKTYQLMVKFFLRHSLRLYLRFFGEGATEAKWVAGHILAHGTKKLTARDLKRANKVMFPGDRAANDACNLLIEYGWLEAVKKRQFDLPTEWLVNPIVHTLFAERAKQERDRRKAAGADAMNRKKQARERL